MNEFNIKSKTAGKCRVYPDTPNGLQPSVTSICGALMKYGLIDWAANCAVDFIDKHLSCPPQHLPEDGNDYFDAVLNDARHAHETIRDDAADFGTWAHKLCQLWLERKPEEYMIAEARCMEEIKGDFDKCITLVESFKEWAVKNKLEPVHTEIVLHGEGYSGRCDLIAYRTDPKTKKRVLGLYDIKTGKGSYYPEWGLQLAAYAESFEEMVFNGILDYPHDEIGIEEIGIIKLNKDTLKCNFSEQGKPKFTADRARLTNAWTHLVRFYWLYNDLQNQFMEIANDARPEEVS